MRRNATRARAIYNRGPTRTRGVCVPKVATKGGADLESEFAPFPGVLGTETTSSPHGTYVCWGNRSKPAVASPAVLVWRSARFRDLRAVRPYRPCRMPYAIADHAEPVQCSSAGIKRNADGRWRCAPP